MRRSDGERMRYAYARAIADGSTIAREALANFLAGEFDFSGVDYYIKQQYYQSPAFRDYLNGLRDNETVAQLADGTRKLTLPDDQNYNPAVFARMAPITLLPLFILRGCNWITR